ncbi:MAG TPA: hypothetical protein VJ826_14950 [Candidatus Polarisedimenticolaceae bacterium]|nr:hypothetical protein [Candidatus Polarisedimenticolaceae bacterium]
MERLENRARSAYERARLREAMLSAWPVPLLAALALYLGGERGDIALAAAVLILVVVALRWRGGALGHGVTPGLLAGGVPLVIPSLVMGAAQACSASCSFWCAWSCVVGGLVAGGVVGWLAASRAGGRVAFLVAGAAVAALTGTMGCCLMGGTGVGGMLLGFLAAAAPIAMLAPHRV